MPNELSPNLSELFDVRNKLLSCKTRKELIDTTIDLTLKKLRSQIASVFLLSKDGKLERIAIGGKNVTGDVIENSWYTDEILKSGESFTGKVIVAQHGSRFGKPIWSNDLSKEEIGEYSRRRYTDLLGRLTCAVAVPLNGKHITFGVLEAINKEYQEGQEDRDIPQTFTEDDLYWLSNIAIDLATGISNLRRDNEIKVLTDMSNMLVSPIYDLNDIHQKVAELLVGELTSYKACIIRLANYNKLSIVAKAGNVTWSPRFDDPIGPSERIAWKVYRDRTREVVTNIVDRSNEFHNYKWIRQNNLKSCVIMPIMTRNSVFGTITLFTGFEYEFYERNLGFLENIAALIGSYEDSLQRRQEDLQTQDELQIEYEKRMQRSRIVSLSVSVDIAHDFKLKLQTLKAELEKAVTAKPVAGQNIMRGQINVITDLIAKLEGDLGDVTEMTSDTITDVNDIITDVVKYFRLSLKNSSDIRFDVSLDRTIRPIIAAEIHIEEIMSNLISNAVKAVQQAQKRNGLVRVQSSIVSLKDGEHIQITVEDNGMGIDKKDVENIYRRGYTTYDSGTGMGLYIVQNVLRLYGGRINFESTVGKGTKFYVNLPKVLEI